MMNLRVVSLRAIKRAKDNIVLLGVLVQPEVFPEVHDTFGHQPGLPTNPRRQNYLGTLVAIE